MDRVENCQEYFAKVPERFVADAAGGVNASILFDISGDAGGQWTVTIADNAVSVEEGAVGKAKVTIMMKDTDYVDMANGDLDGARAFMTRKLKVKGSIPLAQKMKKFLPPNS